MKKQQNKLKPITNTNRQVEAKTQKIAVCALIYNTDYDILSVSRKDNDTDKGLIGGKIEDNEMLVEGLIREVKEETGLDVVKHTLLWERMDSDYKVYTFLTKCHGKIETNESGLVEWLKSEQIQLLEQGSFGEYNKRLFEYIFKNENNYNFKDYVSVDIKTSEEIKSE